MSNNEADICANCGWPAENCGLAYEIDGTLAKPWRFAESGLSYRPGCLVCYAFQIHGETDCLQRLAARRYQIDAYRSMFVNIYKAADEAHRRILAGEGDTQ